MSMYAVYAVYAVTHIYVDVDNTRVCHVVVRGVVDQY